MGYDVVKSAKTIEEAVNLALEELNTDEEYVDIEVLEEGTKGLFGIIGSKMARVKVTLRDSSADIARSFLTDVFEKMKVDAELFHRRLIMSL